MGTAHSHNSAFASQIHNAEAAFDGDEWGGEDETFAHGSSNRKARKARTLNFQSARRMKGESAVYAQTNGDDMETGTSRRWRA